jgi:hypothetical protein
MFIKMLSDNDAAGMAIALGLCLKKDKNIRRWTEQLWN